MRRWLAKTIFLSSLILACCTATFASPPSQTNPQSDSDNLLINARVVEVSECHISVIAQTGVEHVIAIDPRETKVMREGKTVSLGDIREGDVVNVELDSYKRVKFARNMSLKAASSQLAKNTRY